MQYQEYDLSYLRYQYDIVKWCSPTVTLPQTLYGYNGTARCRGVIFAPDKGGIARAAKLRSLKKDVTPAELEACGLMCTVLYYNLLEGQTPFCTRYRVSNALIYALRSVRRPCIRCI